MGLTAAAVLLPARFGVGGDGTIPGVSEEEKAPPSAPPAVGELGLLLPALLSTAALAAAEAAAAAAFSCSRAANSSASAKWSARCRLATAAALARSMPELATVFESAPLL